MICQIVADFNPSWQDETDQAEAFEQAVVFAKGIFERRFQHRKAEQNAFEIVRKQAEKCGSGILYLERAMPWKEAVKDLDIYYVIYPSIRDGYNIQAVPLQRRGFFTGNCRSDSVFRRLFWQGPSVFPDCTWGYIILRMYASA